MSLNILEHPVIKRLTAGRVIRVWELRKALVEFWKGNDAGSLCSNCPSYPIAAVGCCVGCVYHDLEKGCTLRNVSCLTFTCQGLSNHLRKRGLWESFQWFSRLAEGDLQHHDRFFNMKRLPGNARLQLIKSTHRWEAKHPYRISILNGVEGEEPKDRRRREKNRGSVENGVGRSGIRCRVNGSTFKTIRKNYPDSPVYEDQKRVDKFRRKETAFNFNYKSKPFTPLVIEGLRER